MYIFNLHNIFQSLPIILQPQASPSCKLLTAYLQNVAVQWTKSNDACKCRARTTLRVLRPLSWLRLKNNSVQSCTDLLPPMQLWFHCAHSGTFAWVAPNDIPPYKAQQLFFFTRQRSYSNKEPWSSPAKLMRMSLYQKRNFSIVMRTRVQINSLALQYFLWVCGSTVQILELTKVWNQG